MDADRVLDELADDPTTPVDLAELNLHFAADVESDLDIPVYLAQLDDLAEQLAPRLTGGLEKQVAELTYFLFEECQFVGNSGEYYDPRNSYMNEVLDRKLGIPISLSVLAMAVGERCGMRVQGVGLPGHFIAKAVRGDEEVLFDPFNGGQILDRTSCARLVTAITGQPFFPSDDAFDPAPPGQIVGRMLNNLKLIYLKSTEYGMAVAVIRRLIRLMPHDVSQRRDLGICLFHADEPGKALAPLQTYLDATPDAEDAPAVRRFLLEARKQVARWN